MVVYLRFNWNGDGDRNLLLGSQGTSSGEAEDLAFIDLVADGDEWDRDNKNFTRDSTLV
jgi:hypothetical protein